MKKTLFVILATISVAASAVEVGITGSNTQTANRYGYGINVSKNLSGIDFIAGLTQFYRESDHQTRFSLTASKEVFKLGKMGFSGRIGSGYLINQQAEDGLIGTIGVGANLPINKTVSFGVSVDRQYGQDKINSFDGNIVTAGFKFGFN